MEPTGATNGFCRLACERCRKQKLGCQWSSKEPGSVCDRCVNAGAPCETNAARRVGRPPRHRHHSLGQNPLLGSSGASMATRHGNSVGGGPYRRDLHPSATTTPITNTQQHPFAATAASTPLRWPGQQHPHPSAALRGNAEDDDGERSDSHFALGPSVLHGASAAPSASSAADFMINFDGDDSWLDQPGLNPGPLPTTMTRAGQGRATGPDDRFQLVAVVPENERSYESSSSGDTGLPNAPFAPPPSHIPAAPATPLPSTHAAAWSSPESSATSPENWQAQLARLSVVLFEMPPNGNARQVAQRGLWIILVPQIVSHMKALQSIIERAATTVATPETMSEDGSDSGGGGANPRCILVDRPAWLLQLSCFTRVVQICRLVLASLRGSLETNSDMIRDMCLEGSMMQDDEPGLKIFVLVQIISHRIDALAVALNLPEHHRARNWVPVSPVGRRPAPLLSRSVPSIIDCILEGVPAERRVFGAPGDRRDTVFEAFRAECELLVTLATKI